MSKLIKNKVENYRKQYMTDSDLMTFADCRKAYKEGLIEGMELLRNAFAEKVFPYTSTEIDGSEDLADQWAVFVRDYPNEQ